MNHLGKMAVAALTMATTNAFATTAVVHLSHDARKASSENIVDVSVQNTSDHDLYVIGYHSILEKPDGRTTGDWLSVHDSFGQSVEYVGRFVKMGAFPADAFIRIAPGQSIAGSVSLSLEYALPPAGSVSVKTSISVYDKIPALLENGDNEFAQPERVASNEVTFPIIGGYVRPTPVAAVLQCTAPQLASTKNAIAAAQVASREAMTFLDGLYYLDPFDPTDPKPPRLHMTPHRRYTNWFSAWDDWAPQPPETGWQYTDNNLIDQTIAAVHARLLRGATTVCDECRGYHPAARGWAEGALIHLCPVNFSDPIIGGTTSQAGTIIHETSHRTDQFAEKTVDLEGVSDRNSAHRLPRHEAARSAANYEYFITDTQLGR